MSGHSPIGTPWRSLALFARYLRQARTTSRNQAANRVVRRIRPPHVSDRPQRQRVFLGAMIATPSGALTYTKVRTTLVARKRRRRPISICGASPGAVVHYNQFNDTLRSSGRVLRGHLRRCCGGLPRCPRTAVAVNAGTTKSALTSGGRALIQQRPNNAVNPSHSAVTALAQGRKRRAVGRAGYRAR